MKRDYSQDKLQWLTIVIVFLLSTSGFAKTNGGLIFSGLDTLNSDAGFDFVLARPCSTSGDNACYAHFSYGWSSGINAYIAGVGSPGRMLDLGKLNLDSIKSAPPDSVMKDDLGLGQLYRFFRIAPDSLSKCIGNVYLLKTATDPRPLWGTPFYAKIRILKFIVVDSASHSIKMVFLWACQMSGAGDLHTSGLDTFHLDTVPTAIRENSLAVSRHSRFAGSGQVFKVVGDVFTVPKDLIGSGASVTVFDLSGRKLGTVATNGCRSVILQQFVKGKGVFVVRVENFFLK